MHKLWCRVGGLQLAILQPHKLLVCQLTSLISGQGIACMQLNTLSQHALERSAANLVCGNFGGSQGAFCRHGVTSSAQLACAAASSADNRLSCCRSPAAMCAVNGWSAYILRKRGTYIFSLSAKLSAPWASLLQPNHGLLHHMFQCF